MTIEQTFLVAGLAFGDEGKGQTCEFLVRHYGAGLVVRHNGGPQAAHNVCMEDGRHFTFAQFGSGTFHPGVKTHLSRFMLVSPTNMMREESALCDVGITDAWARTTVDARALIVTPIHRHLNRLIEESRGEKAHGSCGQGIGACRQFHLEFGDQVLFAGDLADRKRTIEKLRFIQGKAREAAHAYPHQRFTENDPLYDDLAPEHLADCYREWPARVVPGAELKTLLEQTDTTVFEGAQGVLLDEVHGTAPHNTWTDTTFNNAHTLLQESGVDANVIRVGVIRSYYTRHGLGPFPTENPKLQFPEPHNNDTGFQGKFRRGDFDYRSFHDALRILRGVDMIALNHLDQMEVALPLEVRYLPTIYGYGPTYRDRKLRFAED